jgi:hypothetical protein
MRSRYRKACGLFLLSASLKECDFRLLGSSTAQSGTAEWL